MKKKTFFSIVLILLVSLVLASCQSSGGTDGTTDDSGSDSGGDTAAETVTILLWDFGGSEFAWMDNIVIPEFQEKNPNIKIEHVGILEDLKSLKLVVNDKYDELKKIYDDEAGKLLKSQTGYQEQLKVIAQDLDQLKDHLGQISQWNTETQKQLHSIESKMTDPTSPSPME